MEFLDGSWKKEVSSWDALMGEELLNQEAILEGAIHSIRNMGDVAFVIIRRREGLFQTVLVNEDVDFSIHDLKEGMTVRVKGVVNKEERAPMAESFTFVKFRCCLLQLNLFLLQSINGS